MSAAVAESGNDLIASIESVFRDIFLRYRFNNEVNRTGAIV